MRKIIRLIFIIIGILFLINTIFGRYIVLPRYFESLEKRISNDGGIPSNIPICKITRYLIWAFSFKIGIFLITLGALLRTMMNLFKLALFIFGGILYILSAYIPIPGPFSLIFGIGGSLMTIFIVFIILFLSKERSGNYFNKENSIDFRFIGYFFLQWHHIIYVLY